MDLLVGTRVRFHERHRAEQVYRPLRAAGPVGVIVDVEERPSLHGRQVWVRARFGDFITPRVEEWRFERAS
jgi:hypothetical protein